MAMGTAEREEFLAALHVGVISIARADGPPLAVPVWYSYQPGGDVLVQTGPGSLKYRLLERAREFSLVVQDETPPYKYVSVEGPVVDIALDTSQAEREAMAYRYFERADADAYLAQIKDEPVAQLRMRPARWYSVDFTGVPGGS
ncbi:pyridoxamine 5'-phosphate oxidase family protein [Pseudonocardia acaciae]|uniref:pyridoxamine 5'-phosphate oxidase family protein n=1 Tax=Pseudonocardia acaciae TaxID=551276 RepID=UPI000A8AE77D|nr:pyridoxamine 5'-phosphate oxidase family protein [Pseudonocardia acaciae]